MQQILKRLEIIKAAISLEDEETIALHLSKIRSMGEQAEGLDDIFISLDRLDYPRALSRIANFLERHSAVTTYNDPEIAALKMELHGLERRLVDLRGERDECLHAVNDFNRCYNLRLGEILSKILKLKMMIAGAAEAAYTGIEEEVRKKLEEAKEEAR